MPSDAPRAALIVLGGLPGTGKTTVARLLARRLRAAYLRVDEIEVAIREAGVLAAGVGPAGYGVANALASSNLGLGRPVVADCVNPVAESRAAWRAVAARAGAQLVEVELVCSDPEEHRRRVEERRPDIPGHVLPTWASAREHHYEPWREPRLVLDTAKLGADAAVAAIEARLVGGEASVR